MFKRFLRHESGSTAIEYALIAGLLVLAIVASATELGRVVGDSYDNTATKLSEANKR
ncbi:Flp family type IVb pilin [Nitratireductor basaltis]|uniref:Component of type IV pilus, pilin subunit protein n=1 Tax=Nitratireductor basaltis TaxID=472175 RepID=A0A084U7N6_9HYPH|nr:Flp family type IVb pilin [Nitratireductor basaltis]KFB08972.1 Component of type IV pilus, pilin subunit protein [Nitratireductor basaltis]